jgi:putative phosphotransacetylase
MDDKQLRESVLRVVLSELAKQGDFRVPVNASYRHIHLCRKDVDALFSAGYQLTKLRDLIQPGQFACKEQVVMETEAGKLILRVVGPIRSETQIEISVSEAMMLKLEPMLRLSGDIQGTPGCWLNNGSKRLRLDHGVIVAARHMHISPEEAQAYGLKNGDKVSLFVPGLRGSTFQQVIVRSGCGHVLETHIDREEANACNLIDGQLCQITKNEGTIQTAQSLEKFTSQTLPIQHGKVLLSEDDVCAAIHAGQKTIRLGKNTIVTPLAHDAAWENDIELIPE